MVPCFMLSLLKRQQLMLQERFTERYPSCWLVWEPGSWKPPQTDEEADGGDTQLPEHTLDLRPRGGDALCFQLYATRATKVGEFVLGRATDSDIVVNDMTVSRVHLKLQFDATGWTVETFGPPTSAALGDTGLFAGRKAKLPAGGVITIGGVKLTFYDPAGFLKRIAP